MPRRLDGGGARGYPARAVIGGTGLYAGVTGEMVTTVGEDGELVHTLTLIG